MDSGDKQRVIEIWSTVVRVQQHFNDIEMKIRGLFITIVIAVAAAQGFLIEKRLSFPIGSLIILYATVLPLIGVVASYLFYFMDRYWYHRLLMGAVMQGAVIEEKYETEIPELSLGRQISYQSPVKIRNCLVRKLADLVVSDERYKEHKVLHSDAKIELFYKSIMLLFLLWFGFTVLFVGVFVGDLPLSEFLVVKLYAAAFGA